MQHTDTNPAVEAEMDRQFAESLEKLKRTVEAEPSGEILNTFKRFCCFS